MKFFQKKPKATPITFPPNIVDLLTYYGLSVRYSQEEQEELGIQTQDTGILLQEQYYLLTRYNSEPDRFLTALTDLVLPVGGWAVYGASAWVGDLNSSLQERPASRALLDAAVAFLRAERIDPLDVRGDVWFYWISNGGTHETWLSEFPANIIDLLEYYGHSALYDQEEREELGLPTIDIGILWQEKYRLLARAEQDRFFTAVADLVLPVGGWAVYGASIWLCDLGYSVEQLQAHPVSHALLDAAVAVLRAERTPPERVRGNEWFHWCTSGGTHETWLPDAPPSS